MPSNALASEPTKEEAELLKPWATAVEHPVSYYFDLRMSRTNENGTISTIKRQVHWSGKMTPGGPVDELVAMVDEMNRSPKSPQPTSIVVSRGSFVPPNTD